MFMKKQYLLILTMIFALFSSHTSFVYANTSEEVDGIEVMMNVDQEDSSIEISGTIYNHRNEKLENVSIETVVPENLELKEGELFISDIDVDANASYQTSLKLEVIMNEEGMEAVEDDSMLEDITTGEDIGDIEPIVNHDTILQDGEMSITDRADAMSGLKEEAIQSVEKEKSKETPKLNQEVHQEKVPTSDDTNLGGWLCLFILSSAGLMICFRHRKASKGLLCALLALSTLSLNAHAEAFMDTIVVEEEIIIDDEVYFISMYVSYPSFEDDFEESEEEIHEDVADLYDIDADVEDYDGDGISSYDEIEILKTHPGKSDSDENGIDDGDEDFDADGLTNKEELVDGLNPLKADSDEDGLSDGEEVNEYYSDPLNADSDEDGLMDGDEILLGLNPLEVKSDGTTLDSECVFTQSLNAENIEEALFVENDVIPSLTAATTGNMNRRISIEPYNPYAFGESRAIMGKAIEIKGEELGEAVLSFDAQIDAANAVICQYQEDETIYLDTTYNEETHVLSTSIREAGVYFVLNTSVLLDELGVYPTAPTMNDDVPFTQSTGISNEAMAQADIVFVMDSTYSMYDNIQHVKNNMTAFTQELHAQNVSAGLALVDYQDLEADGKDSTKVHSHNNSHWFYDMEAYQNVIDQFTLGDGGDESECAMDALETARLLDYRASAQKYIVMITDADYKVDNRYGIASLEDEIARLKEDGIQCIVVSTQETKESYRKLYEETNGMWLDIDGDFQLELKQLAQEIANDVHKGQWIYLEGPIPIPVQLEGKLEAGSTIDTDKDGIYDIHELGDVVQMSSSELAQLLAQAGVALPEGVDIESVKMYQYKSNPVEKDTDFDGSDDRSDIYPKDNQFEATMHYTIDDSAASCQVDFIMDYRYLLDSDLSVYSKELSKLAVLYASDIYDTVTLEFTKGFNGGSSIPTIFGSMLGLEDVKNYNILGEDYSVDQYDETQAVFGHRKMTYQGQEKEVLIISLRGTNSTIEEWSSNFDVGADTSDYYNATGSHPDWKNKAHHKGFDVASNRVYDKLKAYIAQFVDTNVPVAVLVNGHSRGAAIANILAKDLIDDTDYKVCAYTYATPNTTTSTNTANYPSIFNIVNTDDMIPYMPLTQWGFNRYGVTKSISVAQYYENSLGSAEEGTFEWLTGGLDYNDDSLTQNTLSKIVKIANTREDFYRYTDEEVTKVWEDDLGHTTYAGAVEELEELTEALRSERLLKFCNLSIQSGLLHHVEIHYCPAYLMQTLANMVCGVGPMLGRDVAGRFADAKTAFVASSGKVAIGGMTHPHMQPTYYLIARNNFLPLS